ncbi:MAG: hypothetical protein IJG32_09935 [Selenomonadaceae bacterium]|nr:hypothetical protein [Selenomonadaceae bacterium]
MTEEERKAVAIKETETLLNLYQSGVEKITMELKRTGEYKFGLDSNSTAYTLLNKEFDKRFAEIFVKYDLRPGTLLKLWED